MIGDETGILNADDTLTPSDGTALPVMDPPGRRAAPTDEAGTNAVTVDAARLAGLQRLNAWPRSFTRPGASRPGEDAPRPAAAAAQVPAALDDAEHDDPGPCAGTLVGSAFADAAGARVEVGPEAVRPSR